MADSIALTVSGRRLEKFLRYRIEADLYCADDAFRLELADPGFAIDPGVRCTLLVNGQAELTGLIDRVEDGEDKSGGILTLEGRDLMGLLVDSYVEDFPDMENVPLKALAEQLLKNVPFINRKAIEYQQGLAGAAAGQSGSGAAISALGLGQKNAHLDPARTIFEVLREFAAARGAMFFSLPDGRLVFGRPKAAGAPDYHLVRRRDGRGNNTLRSSRVRDLSCRYSRITVLGQQQGDDLLGADEINTRATVRDPEVPFHKPRVTESSCDGLSPAQEARLLLERQRADALQLTYRVAGHAQNGRNWTINRLCRLQDEPRGIDGVFLIVARTFELSKEEGRTTELRLGLPGVIA